MICLFNVERVLKDQVKIGVGCLVVIRSVHHKVKSNHCKVNEDIIRL